MLTFSLGFAAAGGLSLKEEWRVSQQEEEDYRCYMI